MTNCVINSDNKWEVKKTPVWRSRSVGLCPNPRFSIREDHRKKGAVYGYDGGKKVNGRKRHIVLDSQGLVIGLLVNQANGSEPLGVIVVLHEAKDQLRELKVVWVADRILR
ncbi:transposase [Moorena sp. SIOASIH]|uniref:transposase n=1 Tax=Moorena sp. SIOASIH TaxID=2607817 RepID=UPI0025CFD904|nr:transposase [Moorena sp. SIOASIH]